MKLFTILSVITLFIATGCTTVNPTPFPESTGVVLVGTTYKCDKSELRKKGASMDLETMYESIRYCHYRTESRNTPNDKYTILEDNKATIANVKNAIRKAVDNDLAIIYFSCKTTQLPTTDKDEIDGMDECIKLYDGILKDNEIWEILQYSKSRVFIVFDSDHSETMFRGFDNVTTRNTTNTFNMVCWSACGDTDTLKERSVGSKLTNTIYFRLFNTYDTYDTVFGRVEKAISNKQNVKKTVIGEDFSDKSLFR